MYVVSFSETTIFPMKFPLLFTAILASCVLVVYIISNTTEKKASIIPKMLLWGKCAHRTNTSTLSPRRDLETEESPFLSYADNHFKLYDGVEKFVLFVGYPRSSHSLVGALLDAHPEIIIPHEYGVLEKWKNYQSALLKRKNLQKYALFYDLHQLSLRQALFGIRAGLNSTFVTKKFRYNYNVPGLWQGGYQKKIKVIGDKEGGQTSYFLSKKFDILEEIRQTIAVPLRFIHIVRNPFDNIATMTLRLRGSRDAVREEGTQINNTAQDLERSINNYFKLAATNERVREQYGDAVIDIPGHETVLRPKETLQKLCDHLGVTCSDDYVKKCCKILYGTPSITRHKVVWTEEQKARVTRIMKNYSFLREYLFDKYPN